MIFDIYSSSHQDKLEDGTAEQWGFDPTGRSPYVRLPGAREKIFSPYVLLPDVS